MGRMPIGGLQAILIQILVMHSTDMNSAGTSHIAAALKGYLLVQLYQPPR